MIIESIVKYIISKGVCVIYYKKVWPHLSEHIYIYSNCGRYWRFVYFEQTRSYPSFATVIEFSDPEFFVKLDGVIEEVKYGNRNC